MAQTTPTFNGIAIDIVELTRTPVLYGTTVRAANGTLHRSHRGRKYTFAATCEALTAAQVVQLQSIPLGTAWTFVDEEGVTYTVMFDEGSPYDISISQGAGVRLYDVTINMVEA